MDKTTHTLRDFVEFSKTHPFRIPFYQRGYEKKKEALKQIIKWKKKNM